MSGEGTGIRVTPKAGADGRALEKCASDLQRLILKRVGDVARAAGGLASSTWTDLEDLYVDDGVGRDVLPDEIVFFCDSPAGTADFAMRTTLHWMELAIALERDAILARLDEAGFTGEVATIRKVLARKTKTFVTELRGQLFSLSTWGRKPAEAVESAFLKGLDGELFGKDLKAAERKQLLALLEAGRCECPMCAHLRA